MRALAVAILGLWAACESAVDVAAPAWPAGAELTFTVIDGEATVAWPDAGAGGPLERYEVSVGDQPLTTIPAFEAQAPLPLDLAPEGGDVAVTVTPVGPAAAGEPLSGTWTRPDATAPAWPTAANLSVEVSGANVQVFWPAALDSVGVEAYEVRAAHAPPVFTDGVTLGASLPAPQEASDVSVWALDAAGNRSTALQTTLAAVSQPAVLDFPEDADVWLATGASGGDGWTLAWTPATGDVHAYDVLLDGLQLDDIPGDQAWVALSPEALQPGVEALVMVFARGALGEAGGPLKTFVAVPDDSVPQWPEGAGLQVTAATETTLALAWPASLDPHVSYLLLKDGWPLSDVDFTVADGVVSASVEGLEAWQPYHLGVYAQNAAGALSALLQVDAHTDDLTPPEWPSLSQPTVSTIGTTETLVGWKPASDNIGIAYYEVHLRPKNGDDDGGEADVVAVVTAPDIGATLVGLEPEATYEAWIWAYDAAGQNTPSSVQTWTMPGEGTTPVWPPGATLEVVEVDGSEATLAWTAALEPEPGAVVGYRLFMNWDEVAAVDGSQLEVTIDGVADAASYDLQVLADGTGDHAWGPTTSLSTDDTTAPMWPPGAAVMVEATTWNSVTLSWPAATDNSGTVSYRVQEPEADFAFLESTTTTGAVLDGLAPETAFAWKLVAFDAAFNKSLPLPIAFVTPPHEWTNAEVFAALAPYCGACHTSGTKPFFADQAAFDGLLVGDPAYVVPGDPGASELLNLLEGMGSSGWSQMPPGPGSPYAELDGLAASLQDLSDWIADL